MFKKWKELDEYLLVKYIDGNVKRQNPNGTFMDNGAGKNIPANPIQPGYSEHWKRQVVKDAGPKLKVRIPVKDTVTVVEEEPQAPEMITISGFVRDSIGGTPLPGAAVIVKGEKLEDGKVAILYSATSDINGKYTIEVPQNSVVTFSYFGYLDKEITATGTKEEEIILARDPNALETILWYD